MTSYRFYFLEKRSIVMTTLLNRNSVIALYSDYKSSFNTLLDKDGPFAVHHRNIQSLAIEIYKFLHGLLKINRHFKNQQASYIQPKNLP